MRPNVKFAGLIVVSSAALGGCALDGANGITTAAVAPPKSEPVIQKIDPACLALNNQIARMRKEGTPARLAAVSKGKTKIVRVKREALAKSAELDRLNWEFQAKCTNYPIAAAAGSTTAAPSATAASGVARPSPAAVAARTALRAKAPAKAKKVVIAPSQN